jgi:hypothetical protein
MNFALILGAACLDPFLRQKLYKETAKTARAYGFYLDDVDLGTLKVICADPKQIEEEFRAVQTRICTHPPCPHPGSFLEVLGAALLNAKLRSELFVDPIDAINNCGFALGYLDRYVLTSLIWEDRRQLKEPVEALARKISQLTARATSSMAA